jgi:hypothetical protein
MNYNIEIARKQYKKYLKQIIGKHIFLNQNETNIKIYICGEDVIYNIYSCGDIFEDIAKLYNCRLSIKDKYIIDKYNKTENRTQEIIIDALNHDEKYDFIILPIEEININI